jgi:uncharacterized membrane protein YphA (DoxX/SURF4 family)
VHPVLLAAMRLAVAAVWIYEGLWQKVLRPAPHELAIVQSVALGALTPLQLLRLIGIGETLLGLGVLSGLYARPLAWFQGALLVLMNGIGIAFSGGAIADPVGLVLRNLPLLLCIAALGVHGPGTVAPGPGKAKR